MNAFQRRFVGEVRRCEELEKTFSKYLLTVSQVYVSLLFPFVLFLSLFILPLSILGAGDQSVPYTTIAWSPPPSMSNAVGPSTP